MRITDLPLVVEVKEEYLHLRRDGKSRADAAAELTEAYQDAITVGREDDGLQFWVGLADGQAANRELTADTAEKALAALESFEQTDWEITPGDISRRRTKYAQAPMPEKKMGKPRPRFHCDWQLGDTFAYRLTGPEAEASGVSGQHILLRKVSEVVFGKGDVFPVVTLTLWNEEELPRTADEFRTAPLLRLNSGRFALPPDRYEYRAELIIRSRRELNAAGFQFVGNFPEVPAPADEVIIEDAGSMTMILLEKLERDLNLRIYVARRLNDKAIWRAKHANT